MPYIKKLQAKYTRKRVKDDLLKKPVTCARQVYKLFQDLTDDAKEKLICIHLNPKLEILSYEISAIGTAHSVLADEVEIYRIAMLACASSIIIVHNHPAGHCEPSPDDQKVAQAIYRLGKIHKMPLQDFIIIADDGYFSFHNHKLIEATADH